MGSCPMGISRNRWCVTPSDPIILPFVYPLHFTPRNSMIPSIVLPSSDPAGSIKHSRICLFSTLIMITQVWKLLPNKGRNA